MRLHRTKLLSFLWLYKYLLKAQLLIITVYFAGSCKEKKSHYLLRDTVPREQFTFIDTLKETAIRNYMTNPDTAEYMLDKASYACDSIGLPKKKFQILLEKAEFYQYRKPDFLKSLKNLKDAVTLFIQFPGPYAEDPYIYINIGNFFYRTRYYEKSRSFYNLAITIANKIELKHASAIAMQNIGLSFQQENNDDSAGYYFIKAWQTSTDVGYLTRAQNFYYLSGQYFNTRKLDSVAVMADSGFRMIDYFKKQKKFDLGTVYPKLLVYCEETESNLHYQLYRYFRLINEPANANAHFKTALEHARNIRSNYALCNLKLIQILDSSVAAERIPGEMIADSVLYFAKLINDPFKLQQITDTLAQYFFRQGNQPAFEKYSMLNKTLSDSLEKLRGSKELFESEILISSTAAEQAIQRLNFEKAENMRSLKYHRMVTLFIFLVAIIITLALYFFTRQYRKLQYAYSKLTEKIQQSVNAEEFKKQQNITLVNDSFSEITRELEQLMQDEKIYLNHDLTLNELAVLLQTNKTYLSNILNQQFGLNFNEYMNQFRIKEACRIILDPVNNKLSFDHVLEKSGFSSKSTFYAAFKKFTGMSPATFIKTVHKSTAPVSG